jgi:two-component system, LytTR family, response regulator
MTKNTSEVSKATCVIVDDEWPARETLNNYIQEYCPRLTILNQCDGVNTAFKALTNYSPDIVFLDIEMPGGNGFELLRMFNPVPFKTIFVTAFSQYAVDAFRYTAVNYLMKPLKISELVSAVNKAINEINEKRSLNEMLNLLEGALLNSTRSQQLVITDARGFSVVQISDIVMLEADGYCTHIYTVAKEPLVSTRNLKYFEQILNGRNFMRVHHSFLINLEHVKRYSNQEEILLCNDIRCPLSRMHKRHFIDHYKCDK